MKQCNNTRTYLALRPETPDTELDKHIETCPDCAAYAKRSRSFDTITRAAVMPTVPMELTAQLLALVPGLQTVAPVVRSPRWMRQRRVFIGLSVILTILALGVIGYGLYLLGIGEMFQTIQTWPGIVSAWMSDHLPFLEPVGAAIVTLYQPLLWALSLVLLWQIFEHMPNKTEQSLSS